MNRQPIEKELDARVFPHICVGISGFFLFTVCLAALKSVLGAHFRGLGVTLGVFWGPIRGSWGVFELSKGCLRGSFSGS